jgi:hypothetical protein
MTVLTDRLAFPNLRKVFLIEGTAGQRLILWTLTPAQTNTYETTTALRVSDVKEDGVSLTPRSSIAQVEANESSYYWDQSAGKIYVHCTDDVLPAERTLQAIVSFYFSNYPRVYNGIYYDPRISSLPKLSIRVEKQFGKVGQLGAGNVILRNEDGYFDLLSALQWDAGVAVMKMGVDPPTGGEAAYSEFDTVGTWLIKEWQRKGTDFLLKLEEIKARLKRKIPFEFYTRKTFPLMRESDVGNPIQIAYATSSRCA